MLFRHIYVHIPFCQRRCSYCDFNTFANSEMFMESYCTALARHIRAMGQGKWAPEAGLRIAPEVLSPPSPYERRDVPGPLRRDDLPATVFLGGGTPTALPLHLLELVLRACDDVMPLATAEVTSEANPGTVLNEDYLRGLRSLGVNRLSLGVQSLDDQVLRMLGRIHTAAEARESYEAARRAGFETINLDFIFGLPGQTLEQWRASLEEIVTWGVDHFSLYSLILEEGTPLAAQVAAGRVCVPDEDQTAAMYELAIDVLGAAGYIQYEISNWALPGNGPIVGRDVLPAHAARHNVAYWLNADYLGCGAGAHSHARRRRWSDLRALAMYIGAVREGRPPVDEVITLTGRDIEAETMFMGLRLNTGVGEAHFRERCGRSLDEAWGSELHELVELGLVERDQQAVRLTYRGRLLGNTVFERFV
ncbi:MAG: coproporphyrinogen III oxidase [Herpetosiphonaceae bacterium]|nr:MAG: coproporphyrinogen III oxidase [Herpetosiphonaceae bacterium]